MYNGPLESYHITKLRTNLIQNIMQSPMKKTKACTVQHHHPKPPPNSDDIHYTSSYANIPIYCLNLYAANRKLSYH